LSVVSRILDGKTRLLENEEKKDLVNEKDLD
jgi:hypothetical protein